MASILGIAKTNFYHANDSVKIDFKDGTEKSLADVCKEITPPCRLNPLLCNGHMQTLWAVTSHDAPKLNYKRLILEADISKYVGSFAVDFVVPKSSQLDKSLPERTTFFTETEQKELGSSDSKPMLVVMPGLSGGSHEVYLRKTIAPMVVDEEWEACVVNPRGCNGSKITSGVLYNARATWDLRQLVNYLRDRFPNRPLFGIGFSLGANILTNYLGEEGTNCHFKAAVVCSNPWNLDASALALQRTWMGMEVYSKYMCASMKRLVDLHEDEIFKNTKIDFDEVQKIKYLHEFDRFVQCPTWGYPTEGAYYRDASCIDALLAVKIPFFAINAEDDPISTREAIPYTAFVQNPNAVLCVTSIGGHLSWWEMGGNPWFTRPVKAFLNKIANEAVLESITTDEPVKNMDDAYEPMRRHLYVNFEGHEIAG